jgi:hypothetical protein
MQKRFSLQAMHYLNMVELDFPGEYRGMIIDEIIGAKNLIKEPKFSSTGKLAAHPSFKSFLIERDADSIAIVKRQVDEAMRNMREDIPNTEDCFSYNRPCPFLLNGLCDRK